MELSGARVPNVTCNPLSGLMSPLNPNSVLIAEPTSYSTLMGFAPPSDLEPKLLWGRLRSLLGPAPPFLAASGSHPTKPSTCPLDKGQPALPSTTSLIQLVMSKEALGNTHTL